jgi:hypothetical protein
MPTIRDTPNRDPSKRAPARPDPAGEPHADGANVVKLSDRRRVTKRGPGRGLDDTGPGPSAA